MSKKVIRIDAGSQEEIKQAYRKRGRPLVTSYDAAGWQLKPYEYSYPGLKRCCHPMPGGCKSLATWRTIQRVEGAILHTGYYCGTHLASKLADAGIMSDPGKWFEDIQNNLRLSK